jgi:Ser/Thr protein kinase RdoA (MazF antagonist)
MTGRLAGVPGGLRIPLPGRVLDVAKARLRRPGIDPDTAAAVLERYGPLAAGGVENLPFGWRNRSVVVRTSAGRKVLKRYRDQWEVAAIEHEHSILRHLSTVGFPAVRLETTSGGETLVEQGGARFALFDFDEGANLAGYLLPHARRLRLWAEAGHLLARFHRATDGLLPEGRHHLGYRGASGERSRDLAWHLRAIEGLAREPTHSAGTGSRAHVRWLLDNAGRIAARISALEDTLADAPLTRSVIHGDHGIHNVLFRRDGTAILHDFELSRMDWQLVDLVIVLSRVEPLVGQAFLAGYDTTAGPPTEERRFLREVWQHYRLCGAVQSWSTFARLGDERRLATARARVEEADRISTEDRVAWETTR